jgi:small-conductance mechanosensitive channel
MIQLRVMALLAALCVSALTFGAQDISPPDPLQLAPDWWNYFIIDPEKTSDTLESRIVNASERLVALKPAIPITDQAALVPIVDAVINNLQSYLRFSSEQPPLPPPTVPVEESYSLAEIQELIEELRKAGVARAEEVQEVELLEEAIDAGKSDLNQRKVAYRELDDTSPERLEQGLELMQSRLQLELGKYELAWRRASVKALDSRIDNLQNLVKAAAQRLTASQEAIEASERRKADAEKKAESIRLRLLKAQLAKSGTFAVTPVGQAQARLASQRLTDLEVSATREEIIAAQAGIAVKILRRIAADNLPDPKPDRDFLNAYEEQLSEINEKLPGWRQATSRNREIALSQQEEGDEKLSAVLAEQTEVVNATENTLREIREQLIGASQFGDVLDSLLAEQESSVARSLQTAEDWAGAGWGGVKRLVLTTLFEIGGTPVTTADLIRVIAILFVALWVSKLLRRALQRIGARRESLNQGSIYTLGRILHYVILAIGIIIALSSIGIDFTKFALFASALGVGIGFGLQTLVSNFVAGLIILFEKSLKIGDFVELESGVTGEVREINMRSTLITTNDNIDIVVPNSEFVNGRVTNWTMREVYRRVHIPFGVAYGTDKELVKKAALEAAADVPVTLSGHKRREPQIWFVEFGDSSLNFELVAWLKPDAVKSPGAVHAQYLWEIDNKLRKYDIEVPFPQRDLHVRSVMGKRNIEEFRSGDL